VDTTSNSNDSIRYLRLRPKTEDCYSNSSFAHVIPVYDRTDSLVNVAQLCSSAGSPILEGEINSASAIRAYRLFERLTNDIKRRPMRSFSEHLSPAQTVTLFALVSLIVGFAMNTTFRRTSAPTPTTPVPSAVSTFFGILGPDSNRTVFATTAKAANAPSVTTLNELSLSIYNPDSTSLSITSDSRVVVVSTSSATKVGFVNCKPRPEEVKSTDIIIRPGPRVPIHTPEASMTALPSLLPFVSPSGSKSAALHSVVESLHEVIETRIAHLRNDMDEVLGSVDELTSVIGRQLKASVDKSKGRAKEIQGRVQYRHDRARGKAKELAKKGKEFMQSVNEEVIGRTAMAKKKAHDITHEFANSETWRTYRKLHGEWVAKLREISNDSRHGCYRKSGGNCRSGAQAGSSTNLLSRSYVELYLA